jgi:hypothetical protein
MPPIRPPRPVRAIGRPALRTNLRAGHRDNRVAVAAVAAVAAAAPAQSTDRGFARPALRPARPARPARPSIAVRPGTSAAAPAGHGRRRLALCIGINYVGSPAELRGCINDALTLRDMLAARYGFEVQLLTDSTPAKPTRAGILAAIAGLMSASRGGDVDEVFVSFSGHGNQVDRARAADPGKDEVLVPIDYQSAGYIVDDDLHAMLSGAGCRVTFLVDACHSGSILELRYRYSSSGMSIVDNPRDTIQHPILCLSGCDDRQTSADAYMPESHRYQGAMTTAFLHVLAEANYAVSCKDLLRCVQERLRALQYAQVPQLSSSLLVDDAQQFMTFR